MKRKILQLMVMFMAVTCFYNMSMTHTAKAQETGTNYGAVTSQLSYINITHYPSKTTYTKGDSLDFSDMVVEGFYADGTALPVTDYTITGYDSNLIGSQSVTVSVQGYSSTINVIVLPAKVTNITANSYSTSAVSLTWDAVPDAVRYEIYSFDPNSGTFILTSTALTNNTAFYSAPATVYGIEICAVVSSGGLEYRGGFSDIFNAATAPDFVTGLTVTGTTASTAALTWNAVPGATGYIVYRSQNGGIDYSISSVTPSTTYLDEKLSSGKAYQYKVSAYVYNEKFSGGASNIADTSTNPAKMILKCKAGEQKIRIIWNQITGASYYDIYIGDDISGYTLVTSKKASSDCSYTVEGLTTGQTYQVYALARRIYNGILYQSEASATSAVNITEIPATNTQAKVFATEQDLLKSMSYTSIAFFKKNVKFSKSYVIPGLVSTNVDGFSSNAMCPQGITFAGDYLLLTAYDMNAEENSVIYVMDKKSRELLTTLILPSKTHAGGLAYDGSNLWIPTGKKISSVPMAQIEEAVSSGAPFSYITYNTTCSLSITVSFLTYYNDKLWIGTYNELEKTNMYSYTIEDKDTMPTVTKADTIVMPTRVQGVAFTDKGVLILSRSCQLYKGLRGYMRQLDLYQPDFAKAKKGVISLGDPINTVEMPSMNEGIAIDGSYLYVTFESAAFKDASYKMDRICAFKLTSLNKKAA